MTASIHNGVRFNIIAVAGFWRITVRGLTLGERFVTYAAAYDYAIVYINAHEETL
jgi:hypothetical protein